MFTKGWTEVNESTYSPETEIRSHGPTKLSTREIIEILDSETLGALEHTARLRGSLDCVREPSDSAVPTNHMPEVFETEINRALLSIFEKVVRLNQTLSETYYEIKL